jgi:hypothetical protein
MVLGNYEDWGFSTILVFSFTKVLDETGELKHDVRAHQDASLIALIYLLVRRLLDLNSSQLRLVSEVKLVQELTSYSSRIRHNLPLLH